MLYIRKLFNQDLRDGKQIAFPKEPSLKFFAFDYISKEPDRKISFVFKSIFGEGTLFDGKIITSRLYAAGSESRMDGEVKAFIRDELHAKVNDILIFKNVGTKHTDFELTFVSNTNSVYPFLIKLLGGDNHSVCTIETELASVDYFDEPLQQIYYGAPGTGKSHTINNKTKGYEVIRTTFHPDSDYSTFVGAYKPTMGEPKPIYGFDATGKTVKVEDPKGTIVDEKKIEYKFVKQAFLKAYLKAWKLYTEGVVSSTATTAGSSVAPSAVPSPQQNIDFPILDGELQQNEGESLTNATQQSNIECLPVFLIIEEINRGNCAQIFGDIFQLLDRGDEGFSQYPIESDTDIQQEIERAFKDDPEYKLGCDINVEGVVDGYTSTSGKTLSEDIQSGHVMLLPNNLFIWATMNTSDQSLFPIDSAFKRRWDWKYIKIAQGKDKNGYLLDWKIGIKDAAGNEYDWWKFLEKINVIISSMTQSADKQLGYFFCKANNGVISADTFVNKVLFYLWNDVFKDYAYEDGSLFNFKKNNTDKDEKTLSFPDFFDESGEADEDVVRQFIDNVMNWSEKADEKEQK